MSPMLVTLGTASARGFGYGYKASGPTGTLFLAIGNNNSPYVGAYPFTSSGFGTKISNASGVALTSTNGIKFSPDGKSVVASGITTPFVQGWQWTTAGGFGTQFSNPGTLPVNNAYAQNSMTPDGSVVIIGNTSSPFTIAYQFSSTTGFGTAYANPATLPFNTVFATAFSPSGADVVLGYAHSNAFPFFYGYKWTNASGFGTAYSNPTISETASSNMRVYDTMFYPNGNYVAMAWYWNSGGLNHSDATFQFTSGTGWGTQYHAIATSTTFSGYSVAVHPSGNDQFIGQNVGSTGNYIFGYPWSNPGFGTRYAQPGTQPATASRGRFSPTGAYLAVGTQATPFLYVYPWTVGSGFGTVFSNPGTLPPGNVNMMDWAVTN